MNRLILFIKKTYVLIIFILLEIVAINYYMNSSSYTKARVLTISNSLVGNLHSVISGVGDYFNLRSENDMLLTEIVHLREQIHLQENTPYIINDSVNVNVTPSTYDFVERLYLYSTAAVVNNSIASRENYLTIDKGSREGVNRNMAMITPDGTIVGYVLESSERYSVGISILNTNFRTGGKIKDKEFFGSVWWDGRSHTHVMLSEIPKYADIVVGDTIVTGYSSIFPPDVVIGTVESFELNQSTYYDARVKLATRMPSLKHVLLIDYAHMQEREMLEAEYYNDQEEQ